jgi:hypothetical protein
MNGCRFLLPPYTFLRPDCAQQGPQGLLFFREGAKPRFELGNGETLD